MNQIKKREEIASEFKWDRSLLVKDEKEYVEKKKEIQFLLEKIISLKGKLLESAENLLTYMDTTKKMEKKLIDLYVWANLYKYEDLNNQKANELALNIEEFYNKLMVETSFASPEILKGNLETIEKFYKKEPRLLEFSHLFQNMFRKKKHILSEKEENLISNLTKSYGKSGDTREILNDAEGYLGQVKVNGEVVQINQSNYISLLKNKEQSIRKETFKTYYGFYKQHKNTFASLYSTNVIEDNTIAKIRNYDSASSMALDSENIDSKVYENLLDAVHKNQHLNHTYQNIHKKLIGLESFHIYDNYVESTKEERKDYTITKCQNLLKEALAPLGKNYLEKLNFMFESKYIDYYPNEGKKSGAFQWQRYVCLNHIDTYDSLTTMAHELGHAMNTLYTEEAQPEQYQDNPIFLAEIASTLNEVLLNDYLYKNAKTKEEKQSILVDFLSRVQSTIYRQTMFAEFEYIIHQKEQEGISLTEEYMSSTYYDLVKSYFSKEIILDEEIKYEWMRIPHFYTSFYVYKYAIGLICSLIFAKRILNEEENACTEYLDFLKSGSHDYPLEILKKARIDLTNPAVFDEAFSLISEKIKELESVM